MEEGWRDGGRDPSKIWHTFTGAEALGGPICDRARVIVLLPKRDSLCCRSEEERKKNNKKWPMIDGTKW